ncbi:hypothetical protein AAFF_G00303810 [Aldrovandia affinis]|uniref:Somatostatin/Cortistatin C-terminal domain-containing protein n=1 Tax=Aldrovandia affinis TaxID=143900 RepID=A0AAD7SPB1_9TELE|nr:hypothetical protein AAFF_G00303810 [Aldrovandia affinis]
MLPQRAPSTLALLGLALALCSPSVTAQPALRYKRLLQKARAAATATQDQREQMVEALLSQLVQRRGVAQDSKVTTADRAETLEAKEGKVSQLEWGKQRIGMVQGKQGDRGESADAELEHTPDSPSSLPPRERKAGCKNFYWKTFTSC